MFQSVTLVNIIVALHLVAGYEKNTTTIGDGSPLKGNNSIQSGQVRTDSLHSDNSSFAALGQFRTVINPGNYTIFMGNSSMQDKQNITVSSLSNHSLKADPKRAYNWNNNIIKDKIVASVIENTIMPNIKTEHIKYHPLALLSNYRSVDPYENKSDEMSNGEDSLDKFNKPIELTVNVVIVPDQEWQNKLDNILAKIENRQNESKEITLRLCTIAIKGNKIDTAVEEFVRLNDGKIINDIVRRAYSNNIAKVLKFLHKLADNKWNQWSRGYTALFNVIKASNYLNKSDMLVLASMVKTILDEKTYPYLNITTEAKWEIKNLTDRFPPIVRSLIWEEVCLQNNGEYLYTAYQELNYSPNRRRVFTWTKNTEKFPEGFWKFETAVIDPKYFRVRNVHFNEYLYASQFNETHEVLTWIPGNTDNDCSNAQCTWDVTLHSENSIKLRNIHFETEYLGTRDDLFTENRRITFSLTPKGNYSQFIWKVTSCS